MEPEKGNGGPRGSEGGGLGIKLSLAVLELEVDDTSKDEVIYLSAN